MNKACLVCNKPFAAGHPKAKFCSEACKQKNKREKVTPPIEKDILTAFKQDPKAATPKKAQDLEIPYLDKIIFNTVTGPHQFDTVEEIARFKKVLLRPDIDPYEARFIDWHVPELSNLHRLPLGRVTEIFGPNSAGKSTLITGMALRAQVPTLLIDTESSATPKRLKELGLNTDLVKVIYTPEFEEAYDLVVENIPNFKVIILDSVAAANTRPELEGEAADANIASKAKIMNKLIRIITGPLFRHQTAMIFVNQERTTIGEYHPRIYTPGGTGIHYGAAFRLRFTSQKSSRFPDKPPYQGQVIQAEVFKSKLAAPGNIAKFKLYYQGQNTKEHQGEGQ